MVGTFHDRFELKYFLGFRFLIGFWKLPVTLPLQKFLVKKKEQNKLENKSTIKVLPNVRVFTTTLDKAPNYCYLKF